jgi:hypothetical protein
MQLLIKEKDKQDRQVELNRLVMTIGFGPDCDIDLDPEITPTRLGMFIKKDNEVNFKPLLLDGNIVYRDEPIENMITLANGVMIDYAYFQFGLHSEPRVTNLNPNVNITHHQPEEQTGKQVNYGNPAGALRAYASSMKSVNFAKNEGSDEDVKISSQPINQNKGKEEVNKPKTVKIEEPKVEKNDKPINKLKRTETKDILLKILKTLKNPFELPTKQQRQQFLKNFVGNALREMNLSETLHSETQENIISQINSFGAFDKLLETKNYDSFIITNNEVSFVKPDGSTLQPKKQFYNCYHMLWSLQALFDHYEVASIDGKASFQTFIDDWYIKGFITKNLFYRIIFTHHESNQKLHRITKTDQRFCDALTQKENIMLFYSDKKSCFIELVNLLRKNLKGTTVLFLSKNLVPSKINSLLPEGINLVTVETLEHALEFVAINGMVDIVISDMFEVDYLKSLLKYLSVNSSSWLQIAPFKNADEALKRIENSLQHNIDQPSNYIQNAFQHFYSIEDGQLQESPLTET